MNKFIILSILFSSQLIWGQDPPKIYTTTNDIHINYNHSTVIHWHLDSLKNPDIFQVGSTLKKKNVQFVTDIDSISFMVEAGHQYDFKIQSKNGEIYNTRIDALKDPYFSKYRLWLALFLILILPAIYFYQTSKSPKGYALTSLGIWIPALFWLNTIIAAHWHGSYSHIKDTISSLGQIGSAPEVFVAVTSLVMSILCILFCIDFYRICRKQHISIGPALLSFSMAYSMAWVAFFPLGHEMHGTAGPIPILMMLAVAWSIFSWKGAMFRSLRWWSVISLGIMLLLFMRFIPALQQGYEGLIQRFFWLGWTIWFAAIGFYLNPYRRLNRNLLKN